jgi:simple sugar transport system ATP-binding protein
MRYASPHALVKRGAVAPAAARVWCTVRAVSPLSVHAVDKRFGAVRAVFGASVAFERGKIHAVVGENGAGKSTLLKIAAGLLVPDAGETRIDGAPLTPHTPAEAIRRGVGMVQQHFALVDVFTALENVVLGAEPVGALGRLDLAAARAIASTFARELGAELPLDAHVESLGVGERQRLEIARALYRDARVLILDEPTAVLTPGEASALYATLRRLAEAGRAIVVVTHKLDEVRDHADVVTVMRKGEVIETRPMAKSDADVRALADAIMGANAAAPVAREAHEKRRNAGDPVIALTNVTLGRALRGLSLAVAAGEIVGIAGVEGNGQRELVRVLAGLEPADAGEVRPRPDAVAVVHEDRQHEGLVLDASVRDNVVLGGLARFTKRGLLDVAAIDREARARVAQANAPADVDLPARALSGGNQQKIVLARALAKIERGARALVLAHPTRGVDMGAARAIHARVIDAARGGAAVLVVSADLHELRAICDRIVVMARGRISAELPSTASDHEIGRAMLALNDGAEARA